MIVLHPLALVAIMILVFAVGCIAGWIFGGGEQW